MIIEDITALDKKAFHDAMLAEVRETGTRSTIMLDLFPDMNIEAGLIELHDDKGNTGFFILGSGHLRGDKHVEDCHQALHDGFFGQSANIPFEQFRNKYAPVSDFFRVFAALHETAHLIDKTVGLADYICFEQPLGDWEIDGHNLVVRNVKERIADVASLLFLSVNLRNKDQFQQGLNEVKSFRALVPVPTHYTLDVMDVAVDYAATLSGGKLSLNKAVMLSRPIIESQRQVIEEMSDVVPAFQYIRGEVSSLSNKYAQKIVGRSAELREQLRCECLRLAAPFKPQTGMSAQGLQP